MPQQIGWSVEAKLLYEIKQLTRQLSGRQYILTFPTFASFPIPGITGTLYVDEATGDIYVWNGTAYTILSSGITAINGLIAAAQLLTTGSTGTDFNISSVGTTHTFNIPTASATNRGLLSSGDWTTFNNKQNAITLTTTGTSGAATLVGSTLNIPQYQSVLTNPVTGTGTTNYVPKFTAGSTIGNSQIFDNGTNVGIGTASPVMKFETRDGDIGVSTLNTFSHFLANRNTIPSGAGTSLTGIKFRAYSTGTTYVDGAQILAFSDGAWSSTSAPTYLSFQTTAASSTSPTERLRITSGGDVGIGTSSPTGTTNRFVNIYGAASNELHLTNATTGTTSTDGFTILQSGNDVYQYNYEAGFLEFGTSNASRLRIFANGRVGINTTTDAGDYKLQVVGNQYLSGKLVVGTTSDSGQTVQINSSLRLIPTSTVPTASAGTLYYDTATNKLKLYDGTSWVDLN